MLPSSQPELRGLSNTESSAMLLAGLQFRLRRQLQLLRRARASIRERGWKATWHRARLRDGKDASGDTAALPDAADARAIEPAPLDTAPLDAGPWVLV